MSRIKGLALAVIALGAVGLATTPTPAAAAAKTSSMCLMNYCVEGSPPHCTFDPTCWEQGCPPGCIGN